MQRRSARVAARSLEKTRALSACCNPREAKRQKSSSTSTAPSSLPRLREQKLLGNSAALNVIGIDEAGRGPLAGPVVAAACTVNPEVCIDGINDSKQVSESEREGLFTKLTAPESGVRWAVAIVDSKRIDEINILQATLEGMRASARALISGKGFRSKGLETRCGGDCSQLTDCHAIIDGNRVPEDMPCASEFMVKGDSKEFVIAAASIIAKVTRDRIMLSFHEQWPEYNFKQHKGYPTGQHMAAVATHGACPQHRLTFAPLKHMTKTQLKYKPIDM